MLATINALNEICRRCLAGEGLSRDQAFLLGRALHEFLARRCRTIEEAFGIRSGRGGVSWRVELAMRRRDIALRELAIRYLSHDSVAAQARAIRIMSIRYGASAWRFEKDCGAVPSHYVGTPHEWLWYAFASGAPMPVGERRLRDILPRSVRVRPSTADSPCHRHQSLQ